MAMMALAATSDGNFVSAVTVLRQWGAVGSARAQGAHQAILPQGLSVQVTAAACVDWQPSRKLSEWCLRSGVSSSLVTTGCSTQ
jgi:hypothetical protein